MTLYAVRPDPETGALDDDAAIVEQTKYGWQFLEQAATLWRLVDSARADEIEAIIEQATHAAGDGELRFHRPELEALVRLLSGIDDALVGSGILDSEWHTPAEQLEELAKRVPAMDLKTERTLQNKRSALAEVMMNAISIRNFLKHALETGCVVVLA
jgi:hypothetical protein